MRKFLFVLIVLIACGWYVWNFVNTRPGEQHVTYEPAVKECFSGVSDGSRYCVYKAQQGTNGGIVYHLHGRNLDEHIWNDDTYFTSLVQAYWAASDRKPPVVVTVSYGPIWLLSPKGVAEQSGLLETFTNQTVPAIEKQLGFVPTYRTVSGESMGGLNSLIAGFRYPQIFQRVAALCPPIYRISPFDSWSAIWNEIKATGAEPKTIFGVITLSKRYVQSVAEWNGINPLELVKSFDPSHRTSFYLSAPLYDKYGLFEGNNEVMSVAKARGLDLKWQPLYGNHCAIDINSFADFLL